MYVENIHIKILSFVKELVITPYYTQHLNFKKSRKITGGEAMFRDVG